MTDKMTDKNSPQDHHWHLSMLKLHDSRSVRWVFLGLGSLFVAIGVIGIFLPLLPTTPFMLLAAGCYARGSERFYRWLVYHPKLGPTIREWQAHRSIPYRTKCLAIGLMALTMATSIVLFVQPLALQLGVAAFGVGLAVWMYRIPSRDRISEVVKKS